MRDGTITREIRRLDARIDQLDAEKQALARMLIEQQRVIDALVLCVGDELGISDARAQGYRQRAIQQRWEAAEKRRQAAEAAETKAAAPERE